MENHMIEHPDYEEKPPEKAAEKFPPIPVQEGVTAILCLQYSPGKGFYQIANGIDKIPPEQLYFHLQILQEQIMAHFLTLQQVRMTQEQARTVQLARGRVKSPFGG
jgi:hypothetical protein